MSDLQLTYPFEFHLVGTPRSLQASSQSRERWKERVRDAARQRVQETADFVFLDDRPIALTIYYFAAARMEGDVDNIVKPIMDALVGVAYLTDQVVERVAVQKFEPTTSWNVAEPSEQLAIALDTGTPVLYIRVDDNLGWRDL